VQDLVQHCLDGNSLLLVGSPGTGKTYTARAIIEALRLEGKVVDIISKTHASRTSVVERKRQTTGGAGADTLGTDRCGPSIGS
jgi:type II secretory pathway predicted ATPase ExeA